MRNERARGRPKAGEPLESCKAADGRPVGQREQNTGDPGTLSTKLTSARDTAPPEANDLQIARVAWVAFEDFRDPADVWPEVLADGREA